VGSRTNFSRELERRGVQRSHSKDAADLIATAVKNTLADERGRWVVGPHPEARSEYRMRMRGKEGLRTYVIDRAFRDVDGVGWIVDYKTSRHEGADVAGFLDREQERYAKQLLSYGEALQGARPGLYFPLLRGWREWGG
jgi:ATP-dependent helicase/nuclease subunit A